MGGERLFLSPFVAAAELVEGILANGGTEERCICHPGCRKPDPVQFRQNGRPFLHRLLRAEGVIRLAEGCLFQDCPVHDAPPLSPTGMNSTPAASHAAAMSA